MLPDNRASDGNNLLISLASTVVVGYLTTRFKLFRTLWRFVPLLVIVTAWFLKRQAEDATTVSDTEPATETKVKASA
jgi:hypothetical protein